MTIEVVAVLEVQWGAPRPEAPDFFRINPENRTGGILYDLLGHRNLIVTNACREVVARASDRGTPDPVRLHRNLTYLAPLRLLLVCGWVARNTYRRCGYEQAEPFHVVVMPHPAARWRAESLVAARNVIRLADQGEGPPYQELSL